MQPGCGRSSETASASSGCSARTRAGEADEDSDIDVLVLVDGLTDLEVGVVASEVAPVLIDTGLPIAPLPMSTERLERLRAGERLLARDLDEEGIPL